MLYEEESASLEYAEYLCRDEILRILYGMHNLPSKWEGMGPPLKSIL